MSYDDNFIKETNAHELKMAIEKTKQLDIKSEQRRKIAITFMIVVGVLIVLLSAAISILSNVDKMRKDEYNRTELRHQEIIACTEKGGTMLTIQSGEACFFLKNPEDIPNG